jgi:hypothetical protein
MVSATERVQLPPAAPYASTPLAGSRSSKPCRVGSTPAARSALRAPRPAVVSELALLASRADHRQRLPLLAPRFALRARSPLRARAARFASRPSVTKARAVRSFRRLRLTIPIASIRGRPDGDGPRAPLWWWEFDSPRPHPVSSFDGRYCGCNPLDEGSIPSELSVKQSCPYLLAGQGIPALNRTTRVRIPLGTPSSASLRMASQAGVLELGLLAARAALCNESR